MEGDLAGSETGGETDGLPEPSGVVDEGLGMLLDPQPDQNLGAGLFG